MATTTKRLDDLNDSLTPEQAFFAWMEDVIGRFESRFAYGAWLIDHEEQHPNLILIRPVVARVRANIKAERPEETHQAVLLAFRKVAFLYYLFLKIDFEIESKANVVRLYTLLAFEGFFSAVQQLFLSDLEIHSGLEIHSVLDLHFSLPKSSTTKWFNLVANDVLACKAALEQIQAKYFGGRRILFKSAADELAIQLKSIEELGEMWDGKPGLIPGAKIDDDATRPPILEGLRKSIDPSRKIKTLVNEAKIETLETIGETDAAARFSRSLFKELTAIT
jgi:hypothetical protein